MSSGLQPLSGGLTPLGGGEEKKETATPPSAPVSPPGAPRPVPVARPTVDFYDDEADEGRRRLPWIIGGALLALATLAFFLFRPLGAAATPMTTKPFMAADQSFSCEIPSNWETTALGAAADQGSALSSPGVSLSSGGGKMEVTFSTVRGLVTGQLLFGSDLTPGAMTGQSNALAVAKLQRKGVVKRYGDYKETKQPSCPSAMASVIVTDDKKLSADAVLYEFTARGASLCQRGSIHGYRAVVAGGVLIGAVTCSCDESDWERLKPAFVKFIGSIQEESPKTPGSLTEGGTSLGTNAGGE